MKLILNINETTKIALEKSIENTPSITIEDAALNLIINSLQAKGLLTQKEEHGLDPQYLNASNDD